ncbi:hypothetical protein D3C78_1767150 [compost metagenome]
MSPSTRLAKVPITSLAFMFELVPEPVWKISTGKCCMKSPASSCSTALTIASPRAWSSCLSSILALAAAALASSSARMNWVGMRCWLIGKLFTARWV